MHKHAKATAHTCVAKSQKEVPMQVGFIASDVPAAMVVVVVAVVVLVVVDVVVVDVMVNMWTS